MPCKVLGQNGQAGTIELFGQTYSVHDASIKKGDSALVVVRPEAVFLSATDKKGDSALVVVRPEAVFLSATEGIPIQVESAVYLGSAMEYGIILPNQEKVTVLQSNPSLTRFFKHGTSAFLELDREAIHVLPSAN